MQWHTKHKALPMIVLEAHGVLCIKMDLVE